MTAMAVTVRTNKQRSEMAKRIYMRHKKDNKARGFVQLIRFVGRFDWISQREG